MGLGLRRPPQTAPDDGWGHRDHGDGPGPGALPGAVARIWVGAGRQAGVRPQDLVGAITNEAGIAGALIGAIQISDRFSLVEVPEEAADQVVKALGNSNVRGKKVRVSRDTTDKPRALAKRR